jgi:transcription initiation factor TFIIIB Brf1 subunit/transcription initiation factor TFIIB
VISSLELNSSYQFNEIKNSDFSAGDQYVSMGKRVDNICTLGSHIGYYSSKAFCDYKHQLIETKMQRKFRKLKKYYSLPLKIKNHETDYRILKILNDAAKFLQLTNTVKNRAAYFYQVIKKNAKDIKNHVSLIAFCIFYASRGFSQNSPLSIRELCSILCQMGHRVNPKLIIRDNLEYQKYLKIKNKPHRSEDYIPRFINSIINSNTIHKRMIKKGCDWITDDYRILLEKKCYFILQSIRNKQIGSRNPFILASAIVYCADKLLAREFNTKSILTQRSAAVAMKIPEYSIRDHYVKILKPIFSL